MLPGFVPRLQQELATITPVSMTVEIIAPPQRKYAAWAGGSFVGMRTEYLSFMSVTRQEYDETGPRCVRIVDFDAGIRRTN
jgi:actin-related protein